MMQDDRHQALKRWERARQMEGLRKDSTMLAGPAAWCRFHSTLSTSVSRLPVFILNVFEKDFVCVKACHEPVPAGVPGSYWMVAGGIAWSDYLPGLLRHYRAGLPVPAVFAPVRKLSEELLLRLEALPARELPALFQELRRVGWLPPLLPLTRSTCPSVLPWDNLRSLFQDFRKEDGNVAQGAPHG
jgi:hypothetical protein